MTEQLPPSSDQFDPTSIDAELILQQQNAIRSMVEQRVDAIPAPVNVSALRLERFGLSNDRYDAYADREAPFGGGFTRIVSKEDPSDTYEGVSWMHIGGAMHNPNRYVTDLALRANGDIVGKETVSNNDGQTTKDVSLPANSNDQETAERYRQKLSKMHRIAEDLTAPRTERRQLAPRAPESAPPSRQGRLSKWLGRSSLH